MTLIDLMRHGEPVGGRRYRGQTDDPLSEKGWREMHDAVGQARPWTRIVTSPLKRCAAFAEELAARSNLPLAADRRLMEIAFGEWEGRTPKELEADDAERLIRFYADPEGHTPPGAERIGDFYHRVTDAWRDLLARHAGEHLLLIVHAGVIRMVVSHVLGIPVKHAFRIQVPSAGITRIRVDQLGAYTVPRLVFHGGALAQ